MQGENFKNTIVLKNIPSNMIEEAIIVLKEGKKAWKFEKIDKNNFYEEAKKPIKKDYIVKEAELVVSDYVKKIEENSKDKNEKDKNIKYKRLLKYAYFATGIIILQFIAIVL